MPTNEEIGQALATLCEAAIEMGGMIAGVVEHMPEDGPTTVFHIDIHDATACGHEVQMSFAGGTLQ